MKTFEIDNSSFEEYARCPRAYFFRHVVKRVTNRHNEATTFGQIWHAVLREYYAGKSVDHCGEVMVKLFHELPVQHESHRTYDLMRRGFDAYVKQYKRSSDNFIVCCRPVEGENNHKLRDGTEVKILLELPFRYYLTTVGEVEVFWTGRIDGIVQLKGTDICAVLDHKTTSVLGATLFNSFELSSQFMGYCWAASRLLDLEVRHVIVNVAAFRKPSKTGKELEFVRHTVVFSDEQIEEWKENVAGMVEDIITNTRAADESAGFSESETCFPRHTCNCVGKYGRCSYFDVCSVGKQYRAAQVFSDIYKLNDWNPLTVLEEYND